MADRAAHAGDAIKVASCNICTSCFTTMSLDLLKTRLSPGRREAIRLYLRNPRNRLIEHLTCRLLLGSNLRALAAVYGTDKWGVHRYAQHYEAHFATLRRRRIVLLEIGIGGYGVPESGGESLRMWRTYFPRGRIYGIDIQDKSYHDERRIKTFRGSQDDEVFLDRVIHEIGNPDIIIDDGSHMCVHIIGTFNFLFPRLNDGGCYVVEDTQTSYWPDFGGSDTDPDDPRTTVGFFKQLVHGVNHEERLGSREASYYDKSIISIAFYHNMIFIRKGHNVEGSQKDNLMGWPGAALAEQPGAAPSSERLQAHRHLFSAAALGVLTITDSGRSRYLAGGQASDEIEDFLVWPVGESAQDVFGATEAELGKITVSEV